jgi:2-oxoglutarate ferredoxin oxidoreductase subunit gamma
MKHKHEDTRKEVRIAGFGGQGIVLSAVIMGKAASIYMKKHSAVMQNYGPESRGGACAGGVVIDKEQVDYPYVMKPDVLMVLSQEAYAKYHKNVKPDSMLIIDEDMVELAGDDQITLYKVPATRMAEEAGNKIVANIIMLGSLTGLSDVISLEAMKDAVLSMVPAKTKNLNEKAVMMGYEYGKKLRERVEVAP